MAVSIHRPKPVKPKRPASPKDLNLSQLGDLHLQSKYADSQFGFLLAGLIDSDGHFSKIPQLVICFHEKEMHIPYYLKKEIGYGIVSKLKKKRAATFVISHPLGLENVCNLVHNKLQHHDRINQYNTRLHSVRNFKITESLNFPLHSNAWFTGFFLGDGTFQIKVLKRRRGSEGQEKPEVRVVIQIDQKKDYLLLQAKQAFGGSVGFRGSQDTFYYSSTSFAAAKRLINYFDRFHLMGVKLTQYVLWRKVFLKIQNENYGHTPLNLKWIASVKKRISLLSGL